MQPTFFDPPELLSDADMTRFIEEGYVTLRSKLPQAFHDAAYEELALLEENGRVGHNNLLPCVPQIREVLDEPHIRGALQSLLGPDYYLHFHRHDHVNFPDAAQPLHKDGDNHSHLAIDGRRYHPTRYLMLLYYPQDTPVERGPTGIVPRSQYRPRARLERARSEWGALIAPLLADVNALAERGVPEDERKAIWRERHGALKEQHADLHAAVRMLEQPWEDRKIPLAGPVGTVSIVHFDIVHGRFGPNETDLPRHMVKFLFSRYREPTSASWDNHASDYPGSRDDALAAVHEFQWRWHRGERQSFGKAKLGDPAALVRALDGDDEDSALDAAYRLATHGDAGIGPLLERFLGDDVLRRTLAAWGLAAAGTGAVQPLLDAVAEDDPHLMARTADVLGDIGALAADAIPHLQRWCKHQDANVRLYAVEALGTITEQSGGDPTFTSVLDDPDAWVRRNAVVSLARAGAGGTDPVPALAANLYHESHQVRGWTIEALQRLDDPRARQIALRYLNTTRWDQHPKSGDPNTRR